MLLIKLDNESYIALYMVITLLFYQASMLSAGIVLTFCIAAIELRH